MIANPFSWLYLPTAILLGALHALEPGHAKTLTAAYLIGIKGTKKDALLLGLSVAFTHSIVVIGISIAALWIGKETFTKDVTHWLQIGSGIIVVLLGLWLFVKRIKQMRKNRNHQHHHGAPEPIVIKNILTEGLLEIVDTPAGEKMRYTPTIITSQQLNFKVIINRLGGLEILNFIKETRNDQIIYLSETTPSEPHEFSAEFCILQNDKKEVVLFEMHEPHDHGLSHDDHALLSDDDHAKAHAATIPEYAKKGERPTLGQILAFGAAGGMIPCPASITVMLLALSIGKFSSGLLAVAGFSIGLAITLVGIGLIVVAGLNQLKGSHHFDWFSAKAPILSAGVVMLSGVAALVFAH